MVRNLLLDSRSDISVLLVGSRASATCQGIRRPPHASPIVFAPVEGLERHVVVVVVMSANRHSSGTLGLRTLGFRFCFPRAAMGARSASILLYSEMLEDAWP